MNDASLIEAPIESPAGDDHDMLRRRLAAVMERHALSGAAVSQRTGISVARLSQWRSDTYKGDNDKVAETVRNFLDGIDSAIGVQALAARDPGYQRTQTSERIWAMLTQAQHAPAMVVIAGVPGVGKTVTAGAYARAFPNVWLATMDPTVTSPAQVLQEIARVMSVPLGSPTTLRDRLGERMAGSAGLLVVDEAQHCNPKALDLIRSLYDRYGIGIALIGNYGLFAGTKAPTKEHGFAQFFRRIRKRARFTEATQPDIDIMLDAWGVTEPAQRRFLTQIAGKMWGLAAIGNTIHEATTMAVGADETLSLKHLKAAWSGLNHFEG